MNVLIIEDEMLAAQRLKELLKELDRDIVVVAVIDSVEASVQYLRKQTVADLIFMDIELGDGKSFEIFQQVKIDIPVIFTTAYQQYALRAFKQNTVDYLLKPLNKAELEAALQKFRRWQTSAGKSSPVFASADKNEAANSQRNRFLVKISTRLTSVPVNNIAYFYTRERQFYIKTKNSEDLLFDKCLEEIESEVDEQNFFRANRQFIVHYDAIEKVQAWYSGKLRVHVKPAAYEEIIVSRLRAGEFKKWLGE